MGMVASRGCEMVVGGCCRSCIDEAGEVLLGKISMWIYAHCLLLDDIR